MIIKVHSVKNKVNDMRGSMYIHAYKSEEGNTGLVFHFHKYPEELNKPVYILNFVLLPNEEKALIDMTNLALFDIGFALKCNNGYLDMFKFGRHPSFNATKDTDTEYAHTLSMVEQTSYEIDLPNNHWNSNNRNSLIMKEWAENNERCGFPVCISKALKNPNKPTVYGGIVPTSLDLSLGVVEVDYNPMPF